MQCPNFNSLRVVSFSAAVMSLSYSTIAIGGAIAIGKQPNAYYNLDRFSTADKVLVQSCSAQLISTHKGVLAHTMYLIDAHRGRLLAGIWQEHWAHTVHCAAAGLQYI